MNLSKEKIIEKLKLKADITILETVDSTNRYLKSVSDYDTPEFTTVIAENQTAGRGRFARKFYSPECCGIYMSILLKPDFDISDSVLITAAAAVAVSDAIEELSGKETKIKWVNDILIDSKKVCGILCEGVINPQSGRIESVILGIGINVYKPTEGYDPEIKDIAGAVFDDKKPFMRSTLIAEILNQFYEYYKELENHNFLEKYLSRSAVIGKRITVLKGETPIEATALDIDSDCRLQVQYDDKSQEYLSSGEISIKMPN